MTTSAPTAMEQVGAGLHATSPEPLSFDAHIHVRAFLLERAEGNLLVYSNGVLERHAERLAENGGLSHHYLNHWHESMFGAEWVREALGTSLLCHADDAAEVARRADVTYTFSRRHHLDGDFEVIPTPGHTPGATAYLWDTGEHRALFTGDSLYLREGEWIAAVLDSSNRARYIASLELLRELDFDLLVPWAASAGQLPYAVTDSRDSRRRLGTVIDRLARGEDH